MGLRRTCAALAGVGFLLPGTAWAGHVPTHVTLGNDRQILPANITVDPGDTVTWEWVGPDFNHSTSAFSGQAEFWDSDPTGNNIDHPPSGGVNHTFTHLFNEPGTYAYRCQVHPDRMQGTVKVRGIPTAVVTAAPTSPFTDQTVTFDGSQSFDDAPGTITKYEWDLDGSAATGPQGFEVDTGTVSSTTTSYASTGLRSVRLRVTDDDTPARTAVATVNVTVLSRFPVASFTVSPANPQKGQQVTLTSTSTDPDDPAASLTLAWDLDNDNVFTDATGTPPPQVFAVGPHTVGLRVTDPAGHASTTTRNFTVTNPLPTATFTATPNSVLTGETVNFDGTGATDPAPGTITNYAWDLDGDNVFELSGLNATPSRSYSSPGTITTRLRVTDDDGATSTTTRTVTVSAPPSPEPPPGSSTPPPSEPAPALPAPSPAGDPAPVLPPAVTVAGPARQRALRQRGIVVTGGCDRACSLAVRGSVNVPGASRVFRLRQVTRSLTAAGTVRVKLALPRAAQAAIRSALRRRKRVTATISVAATDSAGTSTSTRRIALIG